MRYWCASNSRFYIWTVLIETRQVNQAVEIPCIIDEKKLEELL
jgi:hypothetical protein